MIHRLLLAVLFGTLTLFGACSDADSDSTQETDHGPLLESLATHVVLGTYGDLKNRLVTLDEAITAWAAAPANQGLLDQSAEAWRQARVPWECSEAFLFGPAAFLSLDPALDSWPVDHQQLADVLASSFELTPDFVAEGLGPMLRGFHTVEYLLFRDGQPREVGSITEREREYLLAASAVLRADGHTLWASWAEGQDGSRPYAEEFALAGRAGSRYTDSVSALLEVVEGMIGICDEVANGKIADPYDEQDPALVESQFSHNSLADFADNLRSVQNVYLGGYHLGSDGEGLNDLVADLDPALDTRIRGELTAAIAAINAIPAPFRNNLDAAGPIEAAQVAITTVMNSLEEDLKPLVLE
jgi:putative iron-regulated protein